jgi:hypothetical protein
MPNGIPKTEFRPACQRLSAAMAGRKILHLIKELRGTWSMQKIVRAGRLVVKF